MVGSRPDSQQAHGGGHDTPGARPLLRRGRQPDQPAPWRRGGRRPVGDRAHRPRLVPLRPPSPHRRQPPRGRDGRPHRHARHRAGTPDPRPRRPGAGPTARPQLGPIRGPAAAWARRAANDVLVHRADAAGTVGAAFPVEPDLAADAIDEFLDLLSNPQVAGAEADPDGPGAAGTVHLHATDTGPEVASEWLVELGSPTFTWRHAHDKATVAVRGPIADVLLVAYRRLPPDT